MRIFNFEFGGDIQPRERESDEELKPGQRKNGRFKPESLKKFATRGSIARKSGRLRSARARIARARVRKHFARFYFLYLSSACEREAHSFAGIARARGAKVEPLPVD